MLLAARHLVDRARHPRARADALLELRRRLEALPGPGETTPELVTLAERMAELREALTLALDGVRSCTRCATGHPEPFGHWPGGHCCGGETTKVFGDDELLALRLSGTTAGRLQPPRSELAGCVFRGPTACSLAPRDRPTLCVRFLCRELEQELRESGELRRIRAIQSELTETFARFVAAARPEEAE